MSPTSTPALLHYNDDIVAAKIAAFNLNVEVESMAQHILEEVAVAFSLDIDGVGTFDLPFLESDENKEARLQYRYVYLKTCHDVTVDIDPASVEPEPAQTGDDVEGGQADFLLNPTTEDIDSLENKIGKAVEVPVKTEHVCASLFRQSQTGRTYDLYLTEEIIVALSAIDIETGATLSVTIDPDHDVAEWEANISDNVKELKVAFLPDAGIVTTDSITG